MIIKKEEYNNQKMSVINIKKKDIFNGFLNNMNKIKLI